METEFKYRDTQGRPIASAPPIRHYTVSEYLDYEILTEWRNEFLKGHVRRMPRILSPPVANLNGACAPASFSSAASSSSARGSSRSCAGAAPAGERRSRV